MNLNYSGAQCGWGQMGLYIRKSIWDQRAKKIRALGTAEALGIGGAADV